MVDLNTYNIFGTIWPVIGVAVPAIIIVIIYLVIYWYCSCCRKADRARRLERHPVTSDRWVPDIHKPMGYKTIYATQDLESTYIPYQNHYNHAIAPIQPMSRI